MSTGDFLRRPVNAPTGQATPIGVQPGTSGVLIARFVIVNGAGDGVFVYAPGTQPALGNPPIAWMGSGLVDPYGNILPSTTGVAASGTFQAGDTIITPSGIFVYLGTPSSTNLSVSIVPGAAGVLDPFGTTADPGVTTYGTSLFAQLYAGQANFFSGVANAGVSAGINSSGTLVFAPVTGGAVQFTAPIAGSLIPVQPGTTGTLEAWHTPPVLLNSWANTAGFTAFRYRKSTWNSVRVEGAISATAATSNTFFTLPTGYVPTNANGAPVGASGGVPAGQAPQIRWDTSGNLSINSAAAVPAADAYFIGADIPLDL